MIWYLTCDISNNSEQTVGHGDILASHLRSLVEILSKATLCDVWKKKILEHMSTNKQFPPYLLEFYTLTNKNNMENPKVNQHLQSTPRSLRYSSSSFLVYT